MRGELSKTWIQEHVPLVVGYVLTVVWAIGVGCILYWRWEEALELPLNELGDFLAGVFAPLAFLWLVVSIMQQQREIAIQIAETRLLRAQSVAEMRQQAEIASLEAAPNLVASLRIMGNSLELRLQNLPPGGIAKDVIVGIDGETREYGNLPPMERGGAGRIFECFSVSGDSIPEDGWVTYRDREEEGWQHDLKFDRAQGAGGSPQVRIRSRRPIG